MTELSDSLAFFVSVDFGAAVLAAVFEIVFFQDQLDSACFIGNIREYHAALVPRGRYSSRQKDFFAGVRERFKLFFRFTDGTRPFRPAGIRVDMGFLQPGKFFAPLLDKFVKHRSNRE